MGVTKESGRLPFNVRIAVEMTMKQISLFRYLGNLLEENGTPHAEIKARIKTTKANFGKIRGAMINMSFNMKKELKPVEMWLPR